GYGPPRVARPRTPGGPRRRLRDLPHGLPARDRAAGRAAHPAHGRGCEHDAGEPAAGERPTTNDQRPTTDDQRPTTRKGAEPGRCREDGRACVGRSSFVVRRWSVKRAMDNPFSMFAPDAVTGFLLN